MVVVVFELSSSLLLPINLPFSAIKSACRLTGIVMLHIDSPVYMNDLSCNVIGIRRR